MSRTGHLSHRSLDAADRPIFLLGAPRAGMPVLREALSRADGVRTLSAAAQRQLNALLAAPAAVADDPNRAQALRHLLTDDAAAPHARLVCRLVQPTAIATLSALFPQAKFIYLQRDPAAQIAAMVRIWQDGKAAFALPGWTALSPYGLARAAEDAWSATTRQILEQLAALSSRRFCAVLYSDLLANIAGETQCLGHFAQLSWRRDVHTAPTLRRHRRRAQAAAAPMHPLSAAAHTVAEQAARALRQRHPMWSDLGIRTGAMPTVLPACRSLSKQVITSRIAASLCLGSMATSGLAKAATVVVTNTQDSGAGSLRAAVVQTNSSTDASNSITFASGVTGTIALTGGALYVSTSLSVTGPGPTSLTLDANHTSSVFVTQAPVGSSLALALSGMTLTHGSANYGGAIAATNASLTLDHMVVQDSNANYGGCIAQTAVSPSPPPFMLNSPIINNPNITITNTIVSGCSARIGGGIAIYNGQTGGAAVMDNLTLTDNVATQSGGLFASNANGTLSIINSTISDNVATYDGGGASLRGLGAVSIDSSLISSNTLLPGGPTTKFDHAAPSLKPGLHATRSDGGGANVSVRNVPSFAMTQSLVADGNSAAMAGGLLVVDSGASIKTSTITGHTALYRGGAIGVYAEEFDTSLTLENSSVFANVALYGPGGLYVSNGAGGGNTHVAATISLSTIVDNGSVYGAGGIFVGDQATATVSNSIIASNINGKNSDSGRADIDSTNNPNSVTVAFSLIQSANPNQFVDGWQQRARHIREPRCSRRSRVV